MDEVAVDCWDVGVSGRLPFFTPRQEGGIVFFKDRCTKPSMLLSCAGRFLAMPARAHLGVAKGRNLRPLATRQPTALVLDTTQERSLSCYATPYLRSCAPAYCDRIAPLVVQGP